MFKQLSLSLALAVLPVTASSAFAAPSPNHVFDLNGSLADSLNPSSTPIARNDAVLGTAGDTFIDSLNAGGVVVGDAVSGFTPGDVYSKEGFGIVDDNGIYDSKATRVQVNHVYSGLPELGTWAVLIVGLIGIGARSRHRSLPPGTEY